MASDPAIVLAARVWDVSPIAYPDMKGGSSDGFRTDYHGNLWSAAG